VRRVDDVGVRLVRLAALAELDVARVLEPRRAANRRQRLALELGEADPADRRRRAGEAEVDHLAREPEPSNICAPQ
jgi:hypothetical protein